MADATVKGDLRVHFRVRSGERSALLGEGEMVIGRSPYCSFSLDHPSLSRVHATLRLVGEELWISDEESFNGTFVNGARIGAPVRVQPGDDIRMGKLALAIEREAATVQTSTGRFPAVRIEDTGDATQAGQPTIPPGAARGT